MENDHTPNPPVLRINPLDRLTINGTHYRAKEKLAKGYALARVDEPDVIEFFAHAELQTLWSSQEFRHEPRFFDLGCIKAKGCDPDALMRELDEETLKETLFAATLCKRFLDHRQNVEEDRRAWKRGQPKIRKASLSDAYLKPWLADQDPKIRQDLNRKTRAREDRHSPTMPSPRTFRRWLKLYTESGETAISLVPNLGRTQGNHDTKLTAESDRLMRKYATRFASKTRPDARKLWNDMKDEVHTLNLSGSPDEKIRPVTWRRFKECINELPKFDVIARREGLDAAKRKLKINREGVFATHIGEHGQMDDCKLNIMQLIAQSGRFRNLSESAIALLERKRPWFGITIDMASRCIVAARRTATCTAEHALAVLHQTVTDKTKLAQSYGCQSSWHHATGFQDLSVDQGSNFMSHEFRRAVADLGSNLIIIPAATPAAHGHIERFNRTLQNSLLGELDGRTFSNPTERGEYDAAKQANLALDELDRIIIKWIVDVYHHRPHSGLGGETPYRAWERLAKEGILRPVPDAETRRRTLGIERTAKIQAQGVRFLGIWYASAALDPYVIQHGFTDITVRLDPQDIGTLSAFIDGAWINLPSRDRIFRGVTLAEWQAAAADLRTRYEDQAILAAPIVHAAIEDIRSIVDIARTRAGFETAADTEKRIAAVEKSMLGRRAIGDDPEGPKQLPDFFGDESAASVPEVDTQSTAPQPPQQEPDRPETNDGIGNNSSEDDDNDDWTL